MSSSQYSFAELRRSLPLEPMEPSAPIDVSEDVNAITTFERIPLTKSSPNHDSRSESDKSLEMMKIELDLRKAQLKKEQLEKERLLVEENFRCQIDLVNADIALGLARLESLRDGGGPCSGREGNDAQNRIDTSPVVHRHNAVPLNPTTEQNIGLNMSSFLPPVVSHNNFTSVVWDQLRLLDCVHVRRTRTRDLNEYYQVVAPGENLVIMGIHLFLERTMWFWLQFVDTDNKEIMRFQDGSCDTMDLLVDGQKISTVTAQKAYFKSILVVQNTLKQPVFKVKSSDKENIFQIQTLSKKVIGYLENKPESGETSHVLQLPMELDVAYKAALIACCFFIDAREKTSCTLL